jgi:uncharacterized membrane protein YGL010W
MDASSKTSITNHILRRRSISDSWKTRRWHGIVAVALSLFLGLFAAYQACSLLPRALLNESESAVSPVMLNSLAVALIYCSVSISLGIVMIAYSLLTLIWILLSWRKGEYDSLLATMAMSWLEQKQSED